MIKFIVLNGYYGKLNTPKNVTVLEFDQNTKSIVVTKNGKTLAKIPSMDQMNNLVNEVPTKLSELLNDVGYITDDDIPTKLSELDNDTHFITLSEAQTAINAAATTVFTYKGTKSAVTDLPTTAKVGDVYVIEDAEYAYTGSTWQKLGTTTDLSSYALQSDVYTKSEADNKFLTEHQSLSAYLTAATANSTFAKQATTLSGYGINDAYTKTEIDDKNYLTEHQSLSAYLTAADADNTFIKPATTLSGYGITDTYTKSEADNKFLTEHQSLSAYLTTENADSTFVKSATTLSGYGITDAYTKEEIDNKGYLTTVNANDALSGKVDKVEGKSLIDDTEIARLSGITNYDDSALQASISNKTDKVLSGHTNEIILANISGGLNLSAVKIGNSTLGEDITNAQLTENIINELGITDPNFTTYAGSGVIFGAGIACDLINIKSTNNQQIYLMRSVSETTWSAGKTALYDTFEYVTASGNLSAQVLVDQLETDGSISEAALNNDYTTISIKTLSDNVIHTFGFGSLTKSSVARESAVKNALKQYASITDLSSHIDNTALHVSAADKELWNGYNDQITALIAASGTLNSQITNESIDNTTCTELLNQIETITTSLN